MNDFSSDDKQHKTPEGGGKVTDRPTKDGSGSRTEFGGKKCRAGFWIIIIRFTDAKLMHSEKRKKKKEKEKKKKTIRESKCSFVSEGGECIIRRASTSKTKWSDAKWRKSIWSTWNDGENEKVWCAGRVKRFKLIRARSLAISPGRERATKWKKTRYSITENKKERESGGVMRREKRPEEDRKWRLIILILGQFGTKQAMRPDRKSPN